MTPEHREKLKSSISPVDVVEWLGYSVSRRNGRNWCHCPIHAYNIGKEDNKDTNCVVDDKGLMCFGCQPHKMADIFEIVQKNLHCSFSEAVTFLEEKSGISEDNYFSEKQSFPFSEEEMELIEMEAHISATYVVGIEKHFLGAKAPSNYRKVTKEGVFLYYEITKHLNISLRKFFFEHRKEFCMLAANKCKQKIDCLDKSKTMTETEKLFMKKELKALGRKLLKVSKDMI